MASANPTSDAESEQKPVAKPAIPKTDNRGQLEKDLFTAVNEGKQDAVVRLVGLPGININAYDDHGMTALEHACYKRQGKICEVLLANGANVNSHEHEHGYSALMFAALSGDREITRMMLEAGAKIGWTNSVNRTAAQMAAFIGQHEIVAMINNHMDREELDYYTVPHDLEKGARITREMTGPLYKLILMNNLNPVKLSLHLRDNPVLLEDWKKTWRFLDFLSSKQMKQKETNEILSMKMHYVATLVKRMGEHKPAKEGVNPVEDWIKSLARGRDADAFPERQEMFVRSTIKAYSYNGQLLQQIVARVAQVEVGGLPSALQVLTESINGQHMANDDDNECITCGTLHAKVCSVCKSVRYCGKECQKYHFSTHKKFCQILKRGSRREAMEAATAAQEQQQAGTAADG